MTLSTEHPSASPTRRSGPRWWRRPWVAPLAVVAVAFVAFSLPPYLSMDPSQSRVPAPDFFPPHFVVLSLHVVFGSIAVITCCLQVWPWFRARHPRAHRIVGRVYVFAGCLPGGLLALVVAVATPFGPVAGASSVVLALLWLGCTLAGWRMARQRRFVDHRRWMIRSFALTMSIITNRLWTVVFVITLAPQLDQTYNGDQAMVAGTIAGLSAWLGWVLPLMLAEWWLERGDAAKRRRRAARQIA
ncbi:DUF2306 domain-containing protein [Nonomuraea turkmeniaca]|uniref:DUF2306 domain-containing protein n=1 Tax=Nonomuraea turkmeniaca TaxID=103838 RepID=A0A5S4F8C0_9ACTN|nr:DUF2306 domain-containing protein [Nonomuraea turkmeniaca]TMR12980.1 DUF2306 domain-containing protein [Nonomuraea turkmeniaca]